MHAAGERRDVHALLDESIDGHRGHATGTVPRKPRKWSRNFKWFREALGDFKFSASPSPTGAVREKKQRGSGGLLSITVNPYTCKGCMECVKVCNDDALRPVRQTPDSLDTLRRDWDFWLSLPTTPREFIRIENLDERIGALETLLLDKTQLHEHGRRRRRVSGLRRKDGGSSVHRRPSKR